MHMGLLRGRGLLNVASRSWAHLKRSRTTAAQPAQIIDNDSYSPGQKLNGYTIQQVVPIPELYLTAIYLEHDRTGAQHLHVARDDSNNVFGVAFRTTPMDSTGVPHILEHTALCGSEKFPVRDPFFKMLNRSLSTFMNAFTASDWTMYPFSTQNAQDYENLLHVYLDAAFFPRLREDDFRQEGWRLEHENLHDKNSPIIFKGVVYNEMKGVFSNSQHLFAQKVQNLLLPSHTYSVVSGGDPHHIPDLTWDQLRSFHATHYHPSNARFYTYGNLPLERRLELIDRHALQKFEQLDFNTSVPLESRWKEPREVNIKCNPDPMAPDPNKQTTVSVSYLLNDITDELESGTLSILGSLLVSGEKSPFSQSLLEANIGSDFSPVIGFDGNTRESTFSVGLQGICEDDVEKVKAIIQDTLEKVAREGFEQERIDALLHKIELSMRHQYEKFGLYLGVSVIPTWTHGTDAIRALQVNRTVEHFKTNLQNNPRYLQEKIKQYFLDNSHRLTVVMNPDEKFDEQRRRQEEQKLTSLVSQLTEADKAQIYEEGLKLEQIQNKEEDLSCLPTLKVEDIERTITPVVTNTIYAGDVPVQVCEQPTNSVTYFRAISNLNNMPEELKPFVPLFCSVVTRMGAGGMDFKELSQQIDLRTGGLGSGCHIMDHHTENNMYEQGVLFSSYCLDNNITHMFNLWTDIFTRLDLSDTNHLRTLIMMSAAELANSLADAGHSFAMSHASSSLTPAARLKEMMGGIEQVTLMKSIAEMPDHGQIVQHLKDIASHLLIKENLRCSINATPDSASEACSKLESFIHCLGEHNSRNCEDLHIKLPFQVNYMARSVATVPYAHEDFASLRILAKVMSSKFLHREIREKGGAYGGGAGGNQPGVFSFFSYRDPNSIKTLDSFDKAVDWAQAGSFSADHIDEAKLSIFSQVDMPVPPGDRGMRQFLTGIDDHMRQKHREQLFQVSKDNLINVANRYLSPDKRVSSVSFLGPENPLTRDSKEWIVNKAQ